MKQSIKLAIAVSTFGGHLSVAGLVGAVLVLSINFPLGHFEAAGQEAVAIRNNPLATSGYATSNSVDRVRYIREELMKPNSNTVLVVAHRGDWRNAPENSLQAIRNSIAMGVDIVEVDVRKTSDGHLVLMHDKTLDRTTTGSGNVCEFSLAELKNLFLKNGQGRSTSHRIPTLEEALLEAKGKIMVNLDKSYDLFSDAYEIAKKTDTIDHIILKGGVSVEQAQSDLGEFLDEVLFMPIVNLEAENAEEITEAYASEMKPVAMEFVFENEVSGLADRLQRLRNRGSRVWLNTLWPNLNAGHDDDLAVIDAEASYGWIVSQGANIIQTDRPEMLLEYLREKELRSERLKSSSIPVKSR